MPPFHVTYSRASILFSRVYKWTYVTDLGSEAESAISAHHTTRTPGRVLRAQHYNNTCNFGPIGRTSTTHFLLHKLHQRGIISTLPHSGQGTIQLGRLHLFPELLPQSKIHISLHRTRIRALTVALSASSRAQVRVIASRAALVTP